jgi:hypothetical protein
MSTGKHSRWLPFESVQSMRVASCITEDPSISKADLLNKYFSTVSAIVTQPYLFGIEFSSSKSPMYFLLSNSFIILSNHGAELEILLPQPICITSKRVTGQIHDY